MDGLGVRPLPANREGACVKKDEAAPETRLIHMRADRLGRVTVNPPLERASTVLFRDEAGLYGAKPTYGRMGLTVHRELEAAMGELEQMIHIAKTLDARLEAKALELDSSDPAKAKALRESALFYVRQRTQDLLTQMAVSVQGYLALDLVKKNNVELVKGVDRASTTTVGALRTAVTVSEAMTNQRLVLGQITALNETTAGIIDSTSTLLREQTGKIHEQAAASTIPLETLQRAFQNIYDTMDEVDTFKIRALDSMKQTVTVLSGEIEKSKGYIARAEGQNQAASKMAESSLLTVES